MLSVALPSSEPDAADRDRRQDNLRRSDAMSLAFQRGARPLFRGAVNLILIRTEKLGGE